jgi:predicted GIY-YIG superfamily endonuclease
MSQPDGTERTALYRLYDAQERLLYIGIAKNPTRRWWQHARDQADSWWPDVARKAVEWFDTRVLAEAAEVEAIKREGPPYNTKDVVSFDPAPGYKRQAAAPSKRVQDHRHTAFLRGMWFLQEAERSGISGPELVAAKLRSDIAAGTYPVGSRLPTNSALSRQFGISVNTVSRGIALLKAEGVVVIRHGRGTFVS